MTVTLVDANVILDVLAGDPVWGAWSEDALARCSSEGQLAINAIIYAEISIGFERAEEVEIAVPAPVFQRLSLPWEAAFLAGKCFLRYRRAGGRRLSPLPDFFIGAHAATSGLRLLTRDPKRFRTYFPRLTLISPKAGRVGGA